MNIFLQNKETGTLVEVVDIQSLINPLDEEIEVRVQEGQEEQDPEPLQKINLGFPSGEDLPRCWIDPAYQASL